MAEPRREMSQWQGGVAPAPSAPTRGRRARYIADSNIGSFT
jgi:hypothetical protein